MVMIEMLLSERFAQTVASINTVSQWQHPYIRDFTWQKLTSAIQFWRPTSPDQNAAAGKSARGELQGRDYRVARAVVKQDPSPTEATLTMVR